MSVFGLSYLAGVREVAVGHLCRDAPEVVEEALELAALARAVEVVHDGGEVHAGALHGIAGPPGYWGI